MIKITATTVQEKGGSRRGEGGGGRGVNGRVSGDRVGRMG